MPHSRITLIRNIGSQWASVSYGTVIVFLLMIFLARTLGPSSLAVFLYVQTIASLFAILQDGGFQVLLFREKTTPTEKELASAESLLSAYFSYIAAITLAGSIIVILAPILYKTAFLLAFVYFAFRCLTNIISSLLKGQGAFVQEALWRIELNTLLALPVVGLLVFTPPSPEKVFIGFIAGQILLFCTKTGRAIFRTPKLQFPPLKIWKSCLAFVIISAATLIYFKSGIVLLKHLQPDLALVGYYGAALQLLEGVVLFATPVAHLIFRSLRQRWLDQRAFNSRLATLLGAALAVGFLGSAAGFLLAPKMILLFYGHAYQPAVDILPLLMLSLIFLLPNFILTQAMIAVNGEKAYAVIATICAVFNIGLNGVLIPRYLATGAAFSTLATEAVLTALAGAWFMRRRKRSKACDFSRT
ncbi:MAG TPA: polysaccharide biosynthesis C-terminal domain-containing protein [Smithellaceae bacterium]|nr:polysaccharide biosynthesis C-terminal domain-containing protein [Smithellaceae bacterium]